MTGSTHAGSWTEGGLNALGDGGAAGEDEGEYSLPDENSVSVPLLAIGVGRDCQGAGNEYALC